MQKSLNFLYPLLGFKKEKIMPYNSFLYWSEADYSIDDYNLLVYYKTDYDSKFIEFEKNVILTNENLIACFQVENGILYIFDLIQFSEDVASFLEGRYSNIKKNSKDKIMLYFGDNTDMVRPGRVIHMSLYPELYRELVSEELGVPEEHLKELMDKYDINTEWCSIPIIENKNYNNKNKTFYL